MLQKSLKLGLLYMHAIFRVLILEAQFQLWYCTRVNDFMIVIVESAGVGFTPHVNTVKAREFCIFVCFMFL